MRLQHPSDTLLVSAAPTLGSPHFAGPTLSPAGRAELYYCTLSLGSSLGHVAFPV